MRGHNVGGKQGTILVEGAHAESKGGKHANQNERTTGEE